MPQLRRSMPYQLEPRGSRGAEARETKRKAAYKPKESHTRQLCKCVNRDGSKRESWHTGEGRCSYCGKYV